MCGFQTLGDTSFPGVLRQLLPLVKPRARGGAEGGAGAEGVAERCGPEELLVLLVYLYSLAGEAQPSHSEEEEEVEEVEGELIGALTLVLTKEAELSPLIQKLTGESRK